MRLFASLFGYLGDLIANTTNGACYWTMLDEEEMPESLLEK